MNRLSELLFRVSLDHQTPLTMRRRNLFVRS